MKTEVHIGRLYKHYKGNLYKVHAVAKCSETLEERVVYEALYENPKGKMWVRPLEMFAESLIVDGKEVPRFALQD